ncbi:MAG: PaaI family thioesterase [Desulfobacteraceae bacterium]|nr:MAG: PaaI family thioesterase [Desulfobacteraceae bacterium]
MTTPPLLRELPRNANHNCFGCSPANPAGLRMRFFTDGRAVYSQVAVPEHLCGWSHIVHGGVLTTILDEIMSWAAIFLLKRIALTRRINVDFIKPAKVGQALRAEGRVSRTDGKNDAVTEAVLIDAAGEVCARATAAFKIFSPAVARRLGIAGEDSIRWFEAVFKAEK